MQTKQNQARRRTRITIETERVLVVKSQSAAVRGWCEQCGAEVTLATPESAARLTGLSRRAVYRLLESGQVHFTEASAVSSEAPISVCLESLTTRRP